MNPSQPRVGALLAGMLIRPRWILGLALVATAIGAVVALAVSAYTLQFAWLLKFVIAVNLAFVIRALTVVHPREHGSE